MPSYEASLALHNIEILDSSLNSLRASHNRLVDEFADEARSRVDDHNELVRGLNNEIRCRTSAVEDLITAFEKRDDLAEPVTYDTLRERLTQGQQRIHDAVGEVVGPRVEAHMAGLQTHGLMSTPDRVAEIKASLMREYAALRPDDHEAEADSEAISNFPKLLQIKQAMLENNVAIMAADQACHQLLASASFEESLKQNAFFAMRLQEAGHKFAVAQERMHADASETKDDVRQLRADQEKTSESLQDVVKRLEDVEGSTKSVGTAALNRLDEQLAHVSLSDTVVASKPDMKNLQLYMSAVRLDLGQITNSISAVSREVKTCRESLSGLERRMDSLERGTQTPIVPAAGQLIHVSDGGRNTPHAATFDSEAFFDAQEAA